jgi:hypothetical protein
MTFYDYRWGVGHNVALAALANVENDLYPYTKLRHVAPRSQPVDLFPVETMLASGAGRGDGFVSAAWEMTMPVEALAYSITKFGLTSAKSAAATIYTREHDVLTYGRYNSFIWRPSPVNGSLEYLRRGLVRVTWRYTRLIRL